jgi:hypothetical protein
MQAADFPAGPLPAVGNAPHRPLPASWRPHKRGAADSPGAAAAAIEQLVALHPWAGRELVAAVLAATQQDAGAAAAVLADMVAPGAQPEPAAPARGPAARAPADEKLHKERAGSSSGSDEEDGGEQGDAYYRHRQQALQLSRRWQRTARASAAAYSSGQHSTARQLAAEAQRLRQEALAAHADAAERIEAENNQHNRQARGPPVLAAGRWVQLTRGDGSRGDLLAASKRRRRAASQAQAAPASTHQHPPNARVLLPDLLLPQTPAAACVQPV